MTNVFIYLAIVVCGAAVLAIELLGTRIIAPFYGSGLYLWSALISVTLAALSVGYAVGGWLADREATLSRLSAIIGAAGLWVTIIPWIQVPVLVAAEALGLQAAVLITATVLFFPPLSLLGMVSPYAIKLKASSLDVVGRTAGNLYAVSTVASVFAAIGTGFFLIPNVGVFRLTLMIGLLLIATALIGLFCRSNKKQLAIAPFALLIAGALGYQIAPAQTADPALGIIAVEQSAYAEIRVVDIDDVRYMVIDGGTHTIVDPVTFESYFPYVNVLDIANNLFTHPGDMLLVGLGGGSVVKNFAANDWKVDAVEIDPVVTQLAYEYFGLRRNEARVYDMDGRQYLISHDKNYDLIIMDAFGSSSIPFHLVTVEAFGLIRSRLSPNGIFAMNIEAVGWDDIVVTALAATVQQQFEHVLVLPIAEPPDQLGNLVILASDRELKLNRDLPEVQGRFSANYDRNHAWDNRFEVDGEGVQVLTDDLNPIDIMTERINLVARRQLHIFFKKHGINW